MYTIALITSKVSIRQNSYSEDMKIKLRLHLTTYLFAKVYRKCQRKSSKKILKLTVQCSVNNLILLKLFELSDMHLHYELTYCHIQSHLDIFTSIADVIQKPYSTMLNKILSIEITVTNQILLRLHSFHHLNDDTFHSVSRNKV